ERVPHTALPPSPTTTALPLLSTWTNAPGIPTVPLCHSEVPSARYTPQFPSVPRRLYAPGLPPVWEDHTASPAEFRTTRLPSSCWSSVYFPFGEVRDWPARSPCPG